MCFNFNLKNFHNFYISEVRYRTRPVTAFHSGPPTSANGTNSTESGSPSAPGTPFIAVHDLTSQTFEKLQENWRNLEAFIRNLRARKSQEDLIRSGTPSDEGTPVVGGEATRRPPYNNVYTFRYHPVVLEGQGTNSADDASNANGRGTPQRTFNGINFNPFPYDPKSEAPKNVDMERHTVATIYTIGICLTIMAIGSVMFILINKCDGSDRNNYSRSSAAYSAGNRITRSVIGAARGTRPTNSSSNNSNNNGRNRNVRSNGRSSNETPQSASSSGSTVVSGVPDTFAKRQIDLPPSYESLFPEGVSKKVNDISQQVPASTSNSVPVPVIHNSTENTRPQDEISNAES